MLLCRQYLAQYSKNYAIKIVFLAKKANKDYYNLHSLNNFSCNGKYTGTFSLQELFFMAECLYKKFLSATSCRNFFRG